MNEEHVVLKIEKYNEFLKQKEKFEKEIKDLKIKEKFNINQYFFIKYYKKEIKIKWKTK